MIEASGPASLLQAISDDELMKGLPEQPHPLPAEEGVFLLQPVSERRRTLEEIDVRKRLAGSRVGRTALLKVEGEFNEKHDGVLFHQLIGLELSGQRFAAWITEPATGNDTPVNLVRFPGLGEDIEGDVGYAHHTHLAKEFPGARTITIANNGMGRFRHRNTGDNSMFGISRMAQERYELTAALVGEEPIVGVATSMGSVILNELAVLNIEDLQRLQIAGNCYYAPAHVAPGRTLVDMAVKFIPYIGVDGVKEFLKTPPEQKVDFLKTLLEAARHTKANLGALATQAAHLLDGSVVAKIEKAVAHYPTAVIAGTRDPVGQLKMWHKLAAKHPKLSIHEVAGRGHAMTLKPERAVPKIGKVVRGMGIITAGL